MANKKMLPRELKLKESVHRLEEKSLLLIREIGDLKHERNSLQKELHYTKNHVKYLQNLVDELEDFKTITRLALPHIQAKPELQAIANYSNDSPEKIK